jgi:hypothetical protein
MKNLKNNLSISLFTLCSFIFFSLQAQAQSFEKGQQNFQIGVGLGSTFMVSGGSGTPPISASYEFGITDKISLGAFAGYAGQKIDLGFATWKYTYILAAAKGAYHFDFGVEKLDPYAGALLGYNIASVSTSSNLPGASAGGVLWGAHAGARYYLTPAIGVFGELGYGISWLNVGVSFKF